MDDASERDDGSAEAQDVPGAEGAVDAPERARSDRCVRFEAPADLSDRAERLTTFIQRLPGMRDVPPTVEHVLRAALINGLAQLEREVKRADPFAGLSASWPREPMHPAPLLPRGDRSSRLVELGPSRLPGGMDTPLMVRVDNPFEEEELALGLLKRRPLRPAPPRALAEPSH